MNTYIGKRRTLVKNQRSLRYEVESKKRKLNNKYNSLLDEDTKEAAKNSTGVDLESLHQNIMKITNIIASDRPQVLSSEYKAIHYIQQTDKFAEKNITEKNLSGLDKMYDQLSKSLFKNIIAPPSQTADELQKTNVRQLETINYSMNRTKANMTYNTVEEAYKKALGSTVVAYDLETYGGVSSKTGAWSPRGITEFSFQEMRVKDYMTDFENGVAKNFESYITKQTAVIGMSQEEANMWLDKIEKALDNTGALKDEELIVTAKRMQMYGNAKFSKAANGITVVDKFPGDEVFKGGYDIEAIKKGFKELVDARKHAQQYINPKTGLLPYHEKMFKEIARIQNQNLTVLDFNGLNFDQPILNGIMNSIMANEYKDNKVAINAINSMFKNGYAVFDPQSRIDAMGVFKEASQIAGTDKVYGEHAGIITRSINKNKLHRQEIFMEGFNPSLMKDMDRHKAEDDTTNVLRAVFEKLEHFKGKKGNNISPFENAMNIIRRDRKEEIGTTIDTENIDKYIFKSRGEISGDGRNILDFTYDEANGTYRMRTNRIVGGKDEASVANKGVVNTGFKVGGSTSKGAYYTIGGVTQHVLNDEELSYLTDVAPEYANRHLYVLKLNPYLADIESIEKHKEYSNSIYRIFTSKDKLEAELSNDFELTATIEEDGIKLKNRNDFAINVIDANGLNKEMVDEIDSLSDKDLLNREIKNYYNKKIEETGASHLSTKTAKRTLDYENLKKAIMAEIGSDNINMKEHLTEAKRISELISRGEDVTSEMQNIYGLVKTHLGFEDKSIGIQQLYSNTLNNYIKTSEKYDMLSPVAGEIRQAIGAKNRQALEIKMESALDYIVDEFARSKYGEDYLFEKAKEIKMTNAEMKSTFQVDVSKFQSDRRNVHKIKTNVTTMDEDGIFSINLNALSTQRFAERVRDLVYGDNDKKKDLASTTSAMIDFVEHLYTNAGVRNNEMQGLRRKIKTGEYKNSAIIAEGVINVLKAEKEHNISSGIIRDTLGNFNPLDDMDFLKDLQAHIATDEGKELIKRAVKQTPDVVTYKAGSKAHLSSIVDDILMPTINVNGEMYKGNKALNHILKTNAATANSDVEKKIFETHWNSIRKSHMKNIEALSSVISNTGGELVTVNGTIFAKYGDEAISFKSLARTVYEYDTLAHVVDKTKVTAHMNIDAITGKTGPQIDAVSNLEIISKDIRKYKGKLEEASKSGKPSAEIVDLFRGKITKEMREESVISGFNVHERLAQKKLGIGSAFGKIMPSLVGVEKDAILQGHEFFDKEAMTILREEIKKLGDKYDGKFTPQMTEAFGKNAIPILESFDGISQTLKELIPYISYSSKDTDIGGKPEMNLYLGADRYMQGPSNMYDAPKRPTLQAGKIDYNMEDLKAGMNEYLSSNKEKFGMVGTIFEDKKQSRAIQGVGVNNIESAITIKKANVGNVGFSVILENNLNRVLEENSVENNVNISVKKLDEAMRIKRLTSMALEEMSLQEQEKIVDSRLIDSVFEHSSNVQHVRNKDLGSYYSDVLDVSDLIDKLTGSEISSVEKKLAKQETKIAERIAESAIQFSYDENGKIQVFTPEGRLVKRGDKILSYYDKYNPDGKVASKIHIGRFQHGVFENAGNIRLKDSEIAKFLNDNLSVIEGESNEDLTKRSLRLLEEKFKVNYFVSDIRQNTYAKYMNDAVEKDMTNAPYIGLGKLDKKIEESLRRYNHSVEGSMDILNGKVIKMSELNTLLKDYVGTGKGVYETREELMAAIDKERHALSDFIYRGIEEFKDVSIIANHQTGKHKNYGMISDNVIGSIYQSLLAKTPQGENAMDTLKKALAEYDVFDKDTMELKTDGTGIYIKPKEGKSSHSQYKFEGQNLLEDVRYLRLGGTNEEGKEIGLKGLVKKLTPELYHENARFYNPETQSIETMEAIGEIIFGPLTFKKGDKQIVEDNVALMSKGLSVLQQAIDPETMTRYDAAVVNALSLNKKAQTTLLDLQSDSKGIKNKLIKKYAKEFGGSLADDDFYMEAEKYAKEAMDNMRKEAMDNMLEAQNTLAGYQDHASPKKIGKQEFGIYNRTKWNYSTVAAMENFIEANDISEEAMMARRDFIMQNAKGIIEADESGKLRLKEGYEGQSAYRIYTEDLIASKIYNEKTDIELKDAYINMKDKDLNFGKYAHLASVKEEILKVAEELGQDKVSIRYAEDLYQAKSAVQATEFNYGTNRISVEQMENLGFKNIDIDELITHGMQQEALAVKNGLDPSLGFGTIFNNNNLLYLGEEFGSRNNPDAYIALPKAGKVLEKSEISKLFQTQLRSLQENLNEYNTGNFSADSDYALNLKDKIIKGVDNVKESIRKYTYDKEGILHDLSTVYSEDAFRLKFSFVNNTHNLDDIGDSALRAELVGRDDHMLKVAKINGTSIADLEKNGIYTDYAFVSESVFEDMGYFSKERLATLPEKYDLESEEGLRAAKKAMKERLKTDGIIANTGRYPMIMDDSEKATRIFLGENVQNNRARVSVVTALSMNADNDGDSASFSILKTRGEDGFNDYLQYKINQEAIGVLDKDGSRNAQFFGEIEALMAYKAAGTNNYFHRQSMEDLHSEVSKAIENGTINSKFTSLKNKALFNEMMYANNGQSPDTKIMQQNKATLDRYVEAAQQLSPDLKDMTPIDITPINASEKNQKALAEYYDEHIKVLTKAREENPNILKELGLGENAITDFRENAIARTMWYESLEETQSKARKSSIGPINVVLQKVRAGADTLYGESINKNDIINHNIAGQVAYELEQEVISAKHGSVVSSISKGRDLKKLTDNYMYNSSDENRQLLLDFFNGTGESKATNLDDKTIEKIWDKLEFGGIVNEKDLNLRNSNDMLKAKRSFIGERYADVLSSLGNSPDAQKAMSFNAVGGTGANFKSYNAPININSAGEFASAVINNDSYEKNKARKSMSQAAEMVTDRIHFGDMSSEGRATSIIADTVGSMKGKGLALGALTVAAGVLVSGFAGSPVDQSGASELAKQEEANNSSNAAPVFVDQGSQVTRSSSKGYIINMKATSNRDVRQTKNAFRSAASEAVGGAVNINMTIRNREVSNEDIEQWITGL